MARTPAGSTPVQPGGVMATCRARAPVVRLPRVSKMSVQASYSETHAWRSPRSGTLSTMGPSRRSRKALLASVSARARTPGGSASSSRLR